MSGSHVELYMVIRPSWVYNKIYIYNKKIFKSIYVFLYACVYGCICRSGGATVRWKDSGAPCGIVMYLRFPDTSSPAAAETGWILLELGSTMVMKWNVMKTSRLPNENWDNKQRSVNIIHKQSSTNSCNMTSVYSLVNYI